MGRARDLANLLNSSGLVPDAKVLALAASKLTGKVSEANAPTNSVIQVVSVPVTNSFTSSSNSMLDITGMTAAITPKFATSKILVMVSMSTSRNGNGYGHAFQVTRNGNAVGIGTLGTTSPNYGFSTNMATNANVYNQNYQFLDSPASASLLTYKVQVRVENTGGTFSLNNNAPYINFGTDVYHAGYASQITLMEIAG